MIFVTVGTQLAFDRMVLTVDQWAQQQGRDDVVAQIGFEAKRPSHIQWVEHMSPQECERHVSECELLVAHAGTGSIFSAMRHRKPIIIMPRRASLGEHRNEHQLATAKHFAAKAHVIVAWDEQELVDYLSHPEKVKVGTDFTPYAEPSLTQAIRDFIDGGV